MQLTHLNTTLLMFHPARNIAKLCVLQNTEICCSESSSKCKYSNSNIHLFSINLITRYGKSHISNSKSYSQLSSMCTWLREEFVIVIIEIL